MRTTVLLFFFLLAFATAKTQDPNFSQFFASPLTLNPALTGKFEGSVRAAGNYRNQWPTIYNAYVTYTGSIDTRILKSTIPEFDQFGIGVLGFSDKSGEGHPLQNNAVAFSTAYHKSLDENGFNQLGLGFQGAFVSKYLDVTKVHFLDQLRSNGFTGLTNEIFDQSNLNLSYFDLNVGVLYNGSSNGSNNYYAGASAYHITRPKETFTGGEFILDPRLTLQMGGRLPLSEYNALHFSAIHSRQANAFNTTIGGAYMLNLNNDLQNSSNLYFGVWTRFNNLNDAIIPYLGLEFSDLHFGLSYDVNISSLSVGSNMRGGAEFSLIYIRKPRDPNARTLNCPKF